MASYMEQFARSFSFEQLRSATDLKKRFVFTMLALIVYRIGTYVPIPGINPEIIAEYMRTTASGFLGMADMYAGGGLQRLAIFTLSVMPYISASIIIQLLSTMYPPLQALRKEGELGKRKLNKYTRFLTVFIASLQALGAAVMIENINVGGESGIIIAQWLFRLSTVVTLMGGTLFVMWLGEQITSRGIGQGISVIIYSGIVAKFIPDLYKTFVVGREEGSYYLVPLVLGIAAVLFGYVVFVEKAQRKIPIQYPRRGNRLEPNALPTHMPLKVNIAGVMPPIFAQAILFIPIMGIGYTFSKNPYVAKFLLWISPGRAPFMIMFCLLIGFFSFFYTHLQFNSEETAENLKKSMAYIPGIRPGKQTADYLERLLNRLTVWGAAYLISICLIPQFIMDRVTIPFYLGGTTILILVSVAIETISQIQAQLFAHQYKGLLGHAKKKMKR